MLNVEFISILLPALAAGLIVLSTHVMLGRQVLQRGIVFIDLAIAQVASLGVVISHVVLDGATEVSLIQPFLPVLFALVISLLIAHLSFSHERELEAIIGCIYVISAATVLLVLAHNPHGAEQIERSLAGRIFWVNSTDLLIPAGISLMFLFLIFCKSHLLQGWLFYPLFASMITISVDLVGVYLVFSTLIMPALGTSHIKGKKGIATACSLGVIGYTSGLFIACWYDLPGGANIVVTLATICLLFRFVHSLLRTS